ncbi:Uncharacterised protein [Serratia marcescens]|uniref:Assembly protein n=1 Tax=Serratia marcescens TaxID=615 RepID=A0A379Y347_SERMA|nr:Uncharacterised protein [Serratia marcescens]
MPDLPDIRLPLDITVKEISGEQLRLTGDTDVLITSLLLQASTQDQHIQLDNFDVKSPQGTLSVQGQATLTGDWPVALTANSALNIDPLKGEKVKLNIGGGLRDELKVALNLSGPVGAQLDVQTRLAEAGLPLALTLQSKQLKWPLSGEAQYQVNDFRLRFNGKATDYALSTRANLKGQDLPPAVLTLDGKGNVEQFKLERLRLAGAAGQYRSHRAGGLEQGHQLDLAIDAERHQYRQAVAGMAGEAGWQDHHARQPARRQLAAAGAGAAAGRQREAE